MFDQQYLKVSTSSYCGDTHSEKYIPLNKIYLATKVSNNVYTILADNGRTITIRLDQCAWLDFNPWRVKLENVEAKDAN